MLKKYVAVLLCSAAFASCSKNVDLKKDESVALSSTPSVAEQMQGMGKMCADTAQARAARDKKATLYKRLGGKTKIQKLVNDFVALHYQNEKVAPFFKNSDLKTAAAKGAAWVITNTGGPKIYKGPSLRESHGHRNISDEVFLATGGDVMQAMKSNGYNEEQTQDLMCLLGSKHDEIVASAATK